MYLVLDVLIAFWSTLVFPTFISDISLSFSNSVFSILFFLALVILFKYTRSKSYSKRMWIFTHVLGFILSLLTASGYSLDAIGEIKFKDIFISIILYTHVYAAVLSAIWGYLQKKESLLYMQPRNIILCKVSNAVEWFMKRPVFVAIFFLLCWLPAYIADFPGGFRYDASKELYQIAHGYNGNYPLLHSVIVTHLLPWAYKYLGSYNAGIALYTAAQMLLLSAVYTHMVFTFYRQKASKILLFAVVLYCGMFPVIQILVVQEVRDVLFSILLTYTIFLFYLMETDKEYFMKSKIKPAMLGICITLTLLARNNNAGIVAILLLFLVHVLLWLSNRKGSIRGGMIMLTVSGVGSYIVISTVLVALCQPVISAAMGNSLSIMSQPVVRAYLMNKDSWTREEVDELGKYIMLNDGIVYWAENADSTKSKLTVDGKFADFFKFWCKIGMKYKGDYIDAILSNTQNMWFPASVIDGYNEVSEEGQPYYEYDKCYYAISNKLEPPAVHMNLSPKILNYYMQIGLNISFEKVPVISMFFSIGFNFWLVLNCIFYALYRKKVKLYLPMSLLLSYTLLSACVPLVLLRYFAAIFLSMPMIMIFTIQPTVSDKGLTIAEWGKDFERFS